MFRLCAVSGILGAYLVLYPAARVLTLVILVFFIRVISFPAIILLGFWFLLQLLEIGPVAPGGAGPGRAVLVVEDGGQGQVRPGVQILDRSVVIDDQVGEGEGGQELLSSLRLRVLSVFLPGKLLESRAVAEAPAPERSLEAQGLGGIDSEQHEARQGPEDCHFPGAADGIDHGPPPQAGQDPARQRPGAALGAHLDSHADERIAAVIEAPASGLVAHHIRKGMHGEPAGGEKLRNFSLA